MSFDDIFYSYICHSDDFEHAFEYEGHYKKKLRRNNMSRVRCEIEFCEDVENEHGNYRNGVRVTCSKCGHTIESFGQSNRSINRCLALLHEECPNNEDNWYEE